MLNPLRRKLPPMRFHPLLTLALLAAPLVAAPIVAQPAPAKRPMTFADLQAIKRVGDPQVSPSGKWVLFSVTDVSLEKNSKTNHLWLGPLAGGKEIQLTYGDGESNGRFSPEGKTISLTMKDQIFEMPFNDATGKVGDAIQVTNTNGGADGAIWSPDGKRLLFVVNVFPECSDLADWAAEDACDIAKQKAADDSPVKAQIFTHLLYRHWNAWTGERRSHVAVVDSDSGRHLRDLTPRSVVGDAETPTFSLGGPLGYAWAPDSHEIAYVTNLEVGLATPTSAMQPGESTNNDIFTLKLDEPDAKAKKVSTSPGSDDGPQYSPDGKYLAWRSQVRNGYESDKFDLVVMNRSNGKIKDLTEKFDGWIDEFSWLPSMSAIVFVSATQGEAPIYLLPFLPDAPEQVVRKRDEPGEFSEVQMLSDGRLVASRMGTNHPTELFATTPLVRQPDGSFGGGQDFMLTHINDSLVASLDFDQGDSFWFSGADDVKVQGFIVRPPNFDPSKKYPLKFLIHGGPQGAWGDAWSYRWNPELFAANGYVVVMINPRGSTGYGQKFLEEVSGDWGGRPYVDLMKGLDYAEAHYPFIDKSRECALGASYGGYMADWVLTHTHRFQCIVTHDGMFNPQSAFGDTEELWFNEWEFRPLASASQDAVVEQTKPAHPWDFFDKPAAEDPFRKWSPMQNIKFAKTPTLIIHSQRDYRLDVSEGLQLFTALQLLNVPSKMLYFPDEGHWVLKPQNSQLWYQTVNDWVDRWTHTNAYAK
jgi:dipeptidyl aminopeptidase/acylaminoacyl peptidase